MQTTENHHVQAQGAALPVANGSLTRALYQGLETPIAALRASMESLNQELWENSKEGLPSSCLDGVLREVELIGHNVRELCAFATPPVPRPLSCSLKEIVSAASQHLAPAQQSRVMAARCEEDHRVRVDGPLLSSCLRRLIENALEATEGCVLVVARLEEGQVSLSVIDEAPNAFGPGWQPAPFHSTKPNHLGLGLALAQRDLALLNGRLEFLSTPGGETCVRITIQTKRTTDDA